VFAETAGRKGISRISVQNLQRKIATDPRMVALPTPPLLSIQKKKKVLSS